MIQIRSAVDDDVAAMEEIGRVTWPATYSFAGADYISDGLARWWSRAALLDSMRDTTVLVAVDRGDVVGMGNIDLRGAAPVIWKLYVLPRAQGTGVGSALLAGLLGAVPAAGRVRLEYVDGNERAAGFYRAKGFAELRREPGERPGWPESVWMERSVAPGD